MLTQTRAVRGVAAALIGVVVALNLGHPAMAEPVTPETLVAERTNQAVELIKSKFTATVTARTWTLNRYGWDLFQDAVGLANSGQLRNASEVVEYTFERVARDPRFYIRAYGAPLTKEYSQAFTGSGFVASPAGFVATAKHVVTKDESITDAFKASGADWAVARDVKFWLKVFKKYDLSDEAMSTIVDASKAYQESTLKVKVAAPQVTVVLGIASADGSRTGKNYPADVVYRSGSATGEDVAVLRIHVDGPLPALALADKPVGQGDTIYVNGFPGLPKFSKAAQLQPTLTKGHVTSIKPNEAGLKLLQHDAITSSGASGAAGLNDVGEVIGMEVLGAIDPKTGASIGENYMMPLESIREALVRSGATVEPGPTATLFNQALDDFYGDRWVKALEGFRQVKDIFPAHPYVDGYISRTQKAIAEHPEVLEVKKADEPFPWTTVGIVAAIMLTLGGAGTGAMLIRRSKAKVPGGDPAGARLVQQGSESADDGATAEWPGAAFLPLTAVPNANGQAHSANAGANGGQPTAGGEDDDVDDIPEEWEPIDYVAGFPDSDTRRAS